MDGGVEFIAGKLHHWEKDYHLECDNLKEGKYLAFVEFAWDQWIPKNKQIFTINCYGTHKIEYKDETNYY